MDQPDPVNSQTQVDALTGEDIRPEVVDATKPVKREWFPEDEDEWYEPDYCKTDRTC